MTSSTKKRLRATLNIAGAAIVVYFLSRAVSDSWGVLRTTLADPPWLPLIGCFVAAFVAMLWIGYVWVLLLRRHRGVIASHLGLGVYFAGESTKYLPGAFWPVLGRGELARRFGVERTSAYPSVLYSLVLNFVLAGMVASACAAPFALSESQPLSGAALVVLLLPFGLLALRPAFIRLLIDLVERFTKISIGLEPLPWRSAVFYVVLYLPAWVLIGVSAFLASETIGASPPLGVLLFGTYVAWVAGFLAVFAPTGLGVREAAFVAIVGPSIGGDVAGAIAVLSRVAFVFADAIGAAAGFAIVGARARRSPIREESQNV